MLNKILSNRKKVYSIATFLSTFIVASLFMMVSSNASSYYMRTVFDEGSFGLITQVISDKAESLETSLERKDGIVYSSILDYTKVYKSGNRVPGSTLIANIVLGNSKYDGETDEDVQKRYDAVKNGDEDALNKGLLFTFPGLTNENGGEDITYVGTSADAARAELVANTLTKGINDALAFIKTYSGTQHIGGEGLRNAVSQLARITSQFPDKTEDTFSTGSAAGNRDFTVRRVTGRNMTWNLGRGVTAKVADELIPVNGLRYTDYLIIAGNYGENNKPVYGYFPWRMEKGYYPGGAMEGYVGTKYTAIAKGDSKTPYKENKYITWGQMAIQAGVNADVRGTISSDNIEDTMTLIGQGLGADLTSTISSVRSLLNLAPIQELILNMGSRNVTHHLGVMTEDMYDTAKTVYTLILAVSLLALGALIVKMIHQKMVSTTNIIAKTSLMEGLQDIMFIGVMLALFPSIFELLLELNYGIVKTFSYSHNYLQAYGVSGAKVLGLETLAGFIVSSMFLSIDTYINVTYLIRAIVVSFLFAISPVMIISYAWGPMQKKLFFSYMRELIGNIFMQSFHAITMTFFAGYNSTNMSAMEAIASTYCFIPITQLFRSLVIGSQGGFSEQLGGKLAGQLTNAATGLHKSDVAARQAKQLHQLQAENAQNTSKANLWNMSKDMVANVAGNALNNAMVDGELGNRVANLAGASKGTKLGSAMSSDKGKAAMGAGAQALLGAGAAGLNYLSSSKAEQENRNNLGEMQMKHSMENIGVGLAQAGIGLGVSSYDASGGGMVSAGMSSVERAASMYGEGLSNTGEGGKAYASAKGMDAASSSMMMHAMSSTRSYADSRKQIKKDERRQLEELQKAEAAEKQQERLEAAKGLDYNLDERGNVQSYDNTANYLRMRDANGNKLEGNNSPIARIEAHQNNNNTINDSATIVFDANKLNNTNVDDNALAKLASMVANKQTNTEEYNKVFEEAVDKFNASRTIEPRLNAKGEVSIVVDRLSDLGINVDEKGRTYTSSKSLNPKHHEENKNNQ